MQEQKNKDIKMEGVIKGFAEKTREAADVEDQIARLEAAKPAGPS